MDLTCAEPKVDEAPVSLVDTDENKAEENRKTIQEIEIYFENKDYIDLLNREASLPELKLQEITSAYECTKDSFIIVFYVANKWNNYLIDGMAKCIEEKYLEKILCAEVCEYMFIEVISNYLYTAKHYISSSHAYKGKLHMFYHNNTN